jgi:hypothetical protein
MRQLMFITLGLSVAAGCTSTPPPEATSSPSGAALQALSARDEATVGQCSRAVDACKAHLPDAAPANTCERIEQHCDDLAARIHQLRAPAEQCWKAVQACEERATGQASCPLDAATCDALEGELKARRDPVVECSARVEACLARLPELPEQAAVACENVAAACDHIADAHAKADGGAPTDEADDLDEDDSADQDEDAADQDEDAADQDEDAVDEDDDVAGDESEDAEDGKPNDVPRGREPRPNASPKSEVTPDAGVDTDGAR